MKLLHVTIQTDNFEKELRFYEEVVGLQVVRDMRPHGRNMVFLANAEGETEIEIIENPDADNAGNGNFSIGFLTDDVLAKREELLAAGMEVSPMIRPNPQVQFFFVEDPTGVSVQFM